MNEYKKQAEDFCEKHGIIVTFKKLGTLPYFDSDKKEVNKKYTIYRDVFEVTIARKDGSNSFTIQFGDSERNTELRNATWMTGDGRPNYKIQNQFERATAFERAKKDCKPHAYDILACITKNDPEDFENFCSNFGYDTDSRSAFKTYQDVQVEWKKVEKFFTEEELQELWDIN